ncbi:MAG: alpha/beta fold hydrolase [Turneriella sp.]|nr:alpha/beta fold hydrolase [Turneriella sp.]
MRRKIVLVAIVLFAGVYYWQYRKLADLRYEYRPVPLAQNFREFYEKKKKQSEAEGVPEHRAERLVIHNAKNDGWAFMYIHGFGASRGEGEYVVDRVAKEFRANTYYLRLPGHGASAEAHAAATFDQYLQTVEEALLHMPLLGKKIVVFGSSTGGLLATFLAARHSDKIFAIILAGPLWDFANKLTRILNYPGGMTLGLWIQGPERDASWKSDPEKRLHPDYGKYWMLKQKTAAVVNVQRLHRYVAKPETFAAVRTPVLLFYHYKDEKHKDDTVDLEAIRKWFPQLGSAATGKNRLVPIADGNHILFSEYVRTDKETVLRTISEWLNSL